MHDHVNLVLPHICVWVYTTTTTQAGTKLLNSH